MKYTRPKRGDLEVKIYSMVKVLILDQYFCCQFGIMNNFQNHFHIILHIGQHCLF